MSLSAAPAHHSVRRTADVKFGPVRDVEVPLPSFLKRFGEIVCASIYGPDNAPAVVVLGGISANRYPCVTSKGSNGWWAGLAGEGCAVDPAKHRIIGIDFIADESGKIAPSTEDQAGAICAVLDANGVRRVRAIVGASYGGMAALSFGQHFADRVERLIVVCAADRPHPTATAYRELQRRIVNLGAAAGKGEEAFALARGIAMLTYRTREEFEQRFRGGIPNEDVLACSEPGAYLRARGFAYRSVMSPGRFLSLSASIDRHQVDPARIRVPSLLIGSASDQLVPPSQMEAMAALYSGPAVLHLLPSLYGHDMFLKDADKVSELVGPFLEAPQ